MSVEDLRAAYKAAQAAQAEAEHELKMTEVMLSIESALVCAMLPNAPELNEMRRLVAKRDRLHREVADKRNDCEDAFTAYISTPRSYEQDAQYEQEAATYE